jgi:phosphatidylserine decarboxylase
MNREGRRFVVFAGLLTLAATLLWLPLVWPGLLLTYGVFLFFRDPERVPPADPQAVVSPADGIVCLLAHVPLPAGLLEGAGGPRPATPVWRVSVFMSVLDVHVNRMPAGGTVTRACCIPGKFFNASLDKASEGNERMLYLMRTGDGQTLAFVQIAGLIARRIVPFVKEGQSLARAERFGLIRFGSRVDVYLPPGVEPGVQVGQLMVAGETPIARLPAC